MENQNEFIFLVERYSEDETVYHAIRPDKIETLKISDTYDRFGQAIDTSDAGDSLILISEKAVDNANMAVLSSSDYCVYINKNKPEMNCISEDEETIKNFIESTFLVSWDEVKDIEDVTEFYDGNGDINDFKNSSFKNLVPNKFGINDYISAYDNSDIFEKIIDKCEEDIDYTYQAETVEGFNYWDGSNWKSIIVKADNYEPEWEILDDEVLENELNEAIENMSFEGEGFGCRKYSYDKWLIVDSYWQGTWSSYEIKEVR